MRLTENPSLFFPVLIGFFAVGCGEPSPGSASTSATVGSGSNGTEDAGESTGDAGSDTTEGTETESSTAGATDTGAVFDVGSKNDLDSPGADQCTGVDLLFVIDNSASMSSNIENLIANFPAFIDAIQNGLEADDGYHVGITTTDDGLDQEGIDPECESLGTLVEYSDLGYCGPYASGGNYMSDADDLAATFTCAATLGSGGDAVEVTVQAAMNAVGVTNTGPNGCNTGFIRDEAMLVVVVITDEEDNAGKDTIGEPPDWLAYFAARKSVETNVVVLSIVGGAPGPGGCGAVDAPRLIAFADAFTHGQSVSICEPDYGPFFEDAVELAAGAFDQCQVPPE